MLSANMETDLERIPTLHTYESWSIFPTSTQVTFSKDLIPTFEAEGQLEAWIENRIRDLLSCPSMIRLNNMLANWTTSVVIKESEPSEEEEVGGYDKTIFYFSVEISNAGTTSNPWHDRQLRMSGSITLNRYDLTSPMQMSLFNSYQVDDHRKVLIHNLVSTPTVKLINSEYMIDNTLIRESMKRRWVSGVWIDECQFEHREDLPRGQPYLELRYNKPTGFGFDPAWVSILHSNSLFSLLG